MKSVLKHSLILVSCLSLLGASGCCLSNDARIERYNRQMDRYYQSYLNGDLNEARQGMLKIVELSDTTHDIKFFRPEAQASEHFWAFGRLYLIESRAGNKEAAEAALLKTRYWFLVEGELAGASPEELNKAVKSCTPEWLKEYFESWDRKQNWGRNPKFKQ